MLKNNIHSIFNQFSLDKDRKVGIVGCGYIGQKLIEDLLVDDEYVVYGFDNSIYEKVPEFYNFYGNDFSKVKECELIILLTTNGDSGIECILEQLTPGTIILSDTQPKVTSPIWEKVLEKECIGLESASMLDGFQYIPTPPNWRGTTLPGCVIQALVESKTDKTYDTQSEFNQVAKRLNILSRLDIPYLMRTKVGNENQALPIFDFSGKKHI